MTHRLEKTVFITGGTSDIGAACIRRFAEKGWNILFSYRRNLGAASELRKEMHSMNIFCEHHKFDFSSPREINAAVDFIKSNRISCLVNNVGTYVDQKKSNELTVADIQKSIMVNFTAPFLLSAAVFPLMLDRGFGRIVNISSIAAKFGGSNESMHYGCAKRALEGITLTYGRDGAQGNVLVNTVRPGVIDTHFHKKFPKNLTNRINLIPMKRLGYPDEVAALVAFLGSEDNTYITRQTIAVSGGE
jgi:3-oxoacyl-[acyl-carrier protein] reductase